MEYELTHSKETYQPRMRWDRNIFYDSHGDSTPPKAVETSKVGHRSFLEAEYQAKTDVKPTKHGVLEPLPGEPWMIVFKKLSCLIVFVRHGA